MVYSSLLVPTQQHSWFAAKALTIRVVGLAPVGKYTIIQVASGDLYKHSATLLCIKAAELELGQEGAYN